MDYNLKSSKSPLILFIIFIMIIASSFAVIKFKNRETKPEEIKEEKKDIKRKIQYYYKNYYYDIEQKNDNFSVTIKEQVICDVAPCNPVRIDDYRINDTEQKKELKKVFEELFANTKEDYLELTSKDVTLDQAIVIESVLEEPEEENPIEYKELEKTTESPLKQKGYILKEQEDGSVIVTIGNRNPKTGSSVNITRIVINKKEITIYVRENRNDEVYTDSNIWISEKPSKISIVSENNDEIYTRVEESEAPAEPSEKKEIDFNVLSKSEYTINKNAGYSITPKEKSTIITITRGQKPTGGYDINVTKVEGNEEEIIVYVEETDPPKGTTVTQALTYPTIQIEVKMKSQKITVINQNNKQFEQLKNEN